MVILVIGAFIIRKEVGNIVTSRLAGCLEVVEEEEEGEAEDVL